MISSGLGALRSCLTERDPATARPVIHAVVVERFTSPPLNVYNILKVTHKKGNL